MKATGWPAGRIVRQHMTKLERDRVLAAKARRVLAAEKAAAKATSKGLPAQSGQAVLSDGRKAGPQHQASGTAEAARKLGVPRSTLQRALKATEPAGETSSPASAQQQRLGSGAGLPIFGKPFLAPRHRRRWAWCRTGGPDGFEIFAPAPLASRCLTHVRLSGGG